MANENGVSQRLLIGDGDDVRTEGWHRPRTATAARLAVAGEIDGYDSMGICEGTDLMTPVRPIARPAVDEDDGALTGSGDIETDRDAIRGCSRLPPCS
jgi:hypothetical protein